MKKLVVAMMCLMMCFSTVVPIQVHACSDLVASMCPNSPSSYPTCGDWEPTFIGNQRSLDTVQVPKKPQRHTFTKQLGRLFTQNTFTRQAKKVLKQLTQSTKEHIFVNTEHIM